MPKHFCDLVFDHLSDYLDEEATREQLCSELQAHLRECPACRADLQMSEVNLRLLSDHLRECSHCRPMMRTIRETINLVHEFSGGAAPDGCLQRLRDRVTGRSGSAPD